MKQTRRKELKTNALSVYLQQIHDAIRRNSRYLIGAAVVVALVLVVGLLVKRSRQDTMQDAWAIYHELRLGDVTRDATLLDRVRALAEEHGDDDDLGPRTLELLGRLSHQRALSLPSDEDRSRRLELIEDARSAYERLLAEFDDDVTLAAGARMGLASVEEALILAGKGDKENVRQLYQQVIDAPCNPYQSQAEGLLEHLDRRLVPLEIVDPPPPPEPPTRPAEETEPPTTVPAGEAEPGPEFGPDAPDSPSAEEPQATEPLADEPPPAGAPADEAPPAAEPASTEPPATSPAS